MAELSKWQVEEEEKYERDLQAVKPGDKFVVGLTSYASATVTIEITEEMIEKVTDDDGKIATGLLRDMIEEEAYAEVPHICAQCSGWGYSNKSLDLGDEWEIEPGGTRKEK